MNNRNLLSRRTFISAGALAASSAMLGLQTCLSAEKDRLPVGCRDTHLKTAGMPDCWTSMIALGAKALEVQVDTDLRCVNLFHPHRKYTLATQEGIDTLRGDLVASRCVITSFMMANRFDEQLDKELDCARKLARAACQLGVKAIRIDVVPRNLAADKFLPFAIETCKKMCDIAAGANVRFGVENHGHWGNNPEVLEALFNGVGPTLGLTMDPGNFYWWGAPMKDLYGICEKFAPRAIHVHCKSIKYPEDQRNVKREIGYEYGKYCSPITEGDLDYKRIVKILLKAKYKGDLCVEDESLNKFKPEERGAVIKKEIAMLQNLV